jgi:hypothetical protein
LKYRTANFNFTIKIKLYQSGDRFVPIVTQRQLEDVLNANPDVEIIEESATFMYWNFDIKTRIDMEATTVDSLSQLHYINPAKRRQLKYKYLLRDWSLTEENNEKINVEFDPLTKALKDDFYNSIFNGPNPIDLTILDTFILRADRVLEMGASEEEANALDPKVSRILTRLWKKRNKNSTESS